MVLLQLSPRLLAKEALREHAKTQGEPTKLQELYAIKDAIMEKVTEAVNQTIEAGALEALAPQLTKQLEALDDAVKVAIFKEAQPTIILPLDHPRVVYEDTNRTCITPKALAQDIRKNIRADDKQIGAAFAELIAKADEMKVHLLIQPEKPWGDLREPEKWVH